MPLISVVIATHNRDRLLARTLAALGEQSWPREQFEVVVIDNASTDDTRAVVQSAASRPGAPAIRLLEEPRPGKSWAVNTGVGAARGSLLAFTDDDVIPETGWLSAFSRAFQNDGVDFAVGRVRPLWEADPPEWLSPALYGVLAIPDNGDRRMPIRAGVNEHLMPIGANMALRSSVVRRIGGWRADLGKLGGTLRSGEDHEFFLRMLAAGLQGTYDPDAIVAHLVPASRLHRGYFRRWLYDNGRIVSRLERRYPTTTRYLLGVPRYLWREALVDAGRVIAAGARRDGRARFASSVRLLWFAGFLHGAAEERLRGGQPPTAESQPALADAREPAGAWQER